MGVLLPARFEKMSGVPEIKIGLGTFRCSTKLSYGGQNRRRDSNPRPAH
jgi:hypothetical protein